jgi:hypothetical protein
MQLKHLLTFAMDGCYVRVKSFYEMQRSVITYAFRHTNDILVVTSALKTDVLKRQYNTNRL